MCNSSKLFLNLFNCYKLFNPIFKIFKLLFFIIFSQLLIWLLDKSNSIKLKFCIKAISKTWQP